MGKIDNITAFFLILGAFVAGYWIVSKLYQKNTMPRFGDTGENNTDKDAKDGNSRQYKYETRNDGQRYSNRVSYYSELLDLRGDHSVENIKKKYREVIAQYHPDKVHHLGHEFSVIAEKKTREINEAYDYFRQRYNIS